MHISADFGQMVHSKQREIEKLHYINLKFVCFFRNFKLLSFGDEAEEEEEEVLAATKNFTTKGNSAHDIAKDPTLSASTGKAGNNGIDSLERLVLLIRKPFQQRTER